MKQVDLRSMINSDAGMNEHVRRSMILKSDGIAGDFKPEYRPTERHLKRRDSKCRELYRIVDPLW